MIILQTRYKSITCRHCAACYRVCKQRLSAIATLWLSDVEWKLYGCVVVKLQDGERFDFSGSLKLLYNEKLLIIANFDK